MTVEFSNTRASVWNSIQSSLQGKGRNLVVANVSALDKKKGSFSAQTNPTSVKQDLVISAYKPNGDWKVGSGYLAESSVWDFVKIHLEYLPIIKSKLKEIEFIVERDPRIIFDQCDGLVF